MKRVGRLVLPLLVVLVAAGALIDHKAFDVSAAAAPDSAGVPVDTAMAPHRLVAYYFHTNYRCASCRKIEAYTREAIEEGFAREIKEGRLVFQLMNLDEKENKHFIKDYKLFTKSVVIVEESQGTKARWKSLPRIWELLNDKVEFVSYVREETRAWLPRASGTP